MTDGISEHIVDRRPQERGVAPDGRIGVGVDLHLAATGRCLEGGVVNNFAEKLGGSEKVLVLVKRGESTLWVPLKKAG